VTYTIVVENHSTTANPTNITDILIIDILPRDTLEPESIHCDPSAGYTCYPINETNYIPLPSGGTIAVTATRQISWFVPALAPTTSVTLTFSGRVVGQPEDSSFSNYASASYRQDGEPEIANSNAVDVTAHIRIEVQSEATISPVSTWFSEDVGGTIGQDWGDFDQDGDLDLALGSSLGATIYRNDDGQLVEMWKSPSDEPESYRLSYGVRWADVIAEPSHYLELIVVGNSVDQTTTGEGVNYIYRYDGNEFSEATELTFPSDYQLVRLAPGDYDGDGDIDLVASTNAINAPCNVGLYRNDGAGSFTGTVTCLSQYATAAVAAADYDDDGDLDLALGAFPGTLQLLLNTRDGQVLTDTSPFGAAPIVLETFMEYIPYDLAWGDYNLDGYPDLAAAYPLQREARIYQNQSATELAPVRPAFRTGPFMAPLAVDWGDFDGDGWLDLAVADSPPTVYRYKGEDKFLEWSSLEFPPNNGQVWSIRGIDLRNRADLDLILSNRDGPSWLFTAVEPHLTPSLTPLKPPLGNWRAGSVAWGDADGDGDLDLLFGSGPPPALLSYLYDNQNGEFAIIQPDGVFEFSGFGAHYVAFGDVTNDGLLDVAIGTSDAIQIYHNNNAELIALELPADRPVRSLAWGDANDDGWLDLLVGYRASPSGQGLLQLYLHQDAQSAMTLAFTTTVDGSVRSLAWGDYDGDYYLDFAVGVEGRGTGVYRNNGDATFDRVWNTSALPTRAVAWADYDNDGDLDLAVGNYGAEDQLWENEGGDLGDAPVWVSTTPYNTTSLAWGDWNNDGYPELAVGGAGERDVVYANVGSVPGSPRLYALWTSSESQTTNGVAWGDRDGDGDLDLAVSREGGDGQNGFYENTLMAPAHLPNAEAWTTPLPNNPTYLYVERPGITSDAYAYSSPEIVGGPFHPTVTVRYHLYDPEENPVSETFFEYSLDGGGQWYDAQPAADSPSPITQTSQFGQEGSFIWDIAADDAVSDDARFRVRVTHQNDVGPIQRATSSATSPPFRVRGLDCFWPTKVSIAVSDSHPDPGDEVVFTGTVGSSSGQLTARWNLGDGTEGSGWMITHTYNSHNIFLVTLWVDGPACPISRPGFASMRLIVGTLLEKAYLPIVFRSYAPRASAAATSVAAGIGEAIASSRPTFEAVEPIVVSPRSPVAPATSPHSVSEEAQAPSGTTAPGVNTIRISRSGTGFEGQPTVGAVSDNVARVAFWSTGDMDQDGENKNPDGSIEIFLAEVNSAGLVNYTQVTSSTGSILGGFNLAPAVSDDGNTFVFFSEGDYKVENTASNNHDQNFEIFLAQIGRSGSISLTQVTDTREDVNVLPSVSVTGTLTETQTYIAFVSSGDLDPNGDNSDGNQEIFLAHVDHDGVTNFAQITKSGSDVVNGQPAIAIHGEHIYITFVSDGDLDLDENQEYNPEIFLAEIDLSDSLTPTLIQVTDTLTDTVNDEPDIAIREEHSCIAFVSNGDLNGDNGDGNQEIFLAGVVGTAITITQITDTSFPVENDQTTISADGERVAYVTIQSTTERQLGIYDISRDKMINLGTGSDIIRPALTADGSGIAFVSDWDVFLTYPPDVDLSIIKTASPKQVGPGDDLTYTFAVINKLSTPATGAWITDVLPAGLTISPTIPQSLPDYIDDDNSETGFSGDGHEHHGTHWDVENQLLALNAPSSLELSDGSGDTEPWNDWTDMTDNVLLLHLNEPVSATTFSDTSIEENNGECSGSTCPTVVSGKLHGALQFDGVDDFVLVPHDASLSLTNFTVSAWVNPTTIKTNYQPLIVKEHVTGGWRNYALFIRPNEMRIHFSFQEGDCVTWRSYDSMGSLMLNTWNHVMMTYDGAHFNLYLNGRLDRSVDINSTVCTNGEPVKIGRELAAFTPFAGQIDEVAIFNQALEANQIQIMYQRQAPAYAAYFDSRVMQGATGTFGWNSIATVTPRPLSVQLPDYGAFEGNYVTGTVDMVGNVSLLHLNEPEKSTVFADTSGWGNNGSCSGTFCPLAGVDGRFGAGLEFDGVDDYIELSQKAIDDSMGDFTIAMWFKTSMPNEGTLYAEGNVDGRGVRLRVEPGDGQIRGYVGEPGDSNIVATDLPFNDGQWHHVAFVARGGNLTRIYVDGALRGETVDRYVSSDPTSAVGVIGRTGEPGSSSPYDHFEGFIDEVAVFDRALTAGQVRNHYLRGALRLKFQVRACSTRECLNQPFVGPDDTSGSYYPTLGDVLIERMFENFEGDYGSNWTQTGLWHSEAELHPCGIRVAPFPSSSRAAYYGRAGICNYDTFFIPNSGELTQNSPVSLVGDVAYLTFWSYERTECGYGNCYYDRRYVDISVDGGPWQNIWGPTGPEGSWYKATVDLSAYIGKNVRVRFRFDTVDFMLNNFFGWMVDDVRILTGSASAFSKDLSNIFPPTFLLEEVDDKEFFQYRAYLETDVYTDAGSLPALNSVTVNPRISCSSDTNPAGREGITCYLDPYAPLAPNGSVAWSIETNVTSEAYGSGGQIVNTVEVNGVGFETDATNDTDSVTTTLKTADLRIAKMVNPTNAAPGSPITYTLTFSNAGDAIAQDVVISDSVPTNVTNVNYNSSGATITPRKGTTYIWDVEDLSKDEDGVIIITGELVTCLPAGQIFTNTATIEGIPSLSASASAAVTVLDAAPVANDDSYSTTEGVPLNVPGPEGEGVLANDADPNCLPLTAALATDVSTGTLNFNADGSFGYTPPPGFSGLATFTYIASDGTLTDTATVRITVNKINNPPIADAGTNQTVLTNTFVILNGNGSTDPDGDPLTYLWTQTGGTPVNLNNDSAISPIFTAPPSATVLTFMLTVTDTDMVIVTVNSTMASLATDDAPFSVEKLSPIPSWNDKAHATALSSDTHLTCQGRKVCSVSLSASALKSAPFELLRTFAHHQR